MKRKFKLWVLRVTYPIWHPAVITAINRAKEGHKFNDEQYIHILSFLDRSQSNYSAEKGEE